MRRILVCFVIVLWWAFSPTQAEAQEGWWDCNSGRSLWIEGNAGTWGVGKVKAIAEHWRTYASDAVPYCNPVYQEVEVWMDNSPPCIDGYGWESGFGSCQHIDYYALPFGWTWAEARVGFDPTEVWGTWHAWAKYYFIRKAEPYYGWWMRQPDGYTERNFGQPGNPLGSHGQPCFMDPNQEGCPPTPIVINIARGNQYKFSSVEDGVVFDLNADGRLDRAAWPTDPDKVAFLALDRNGNGAIDDARELFGDYTIPGVSTGFGALQALVDGDGDGYITEADPLFASLLLWSDLNRNGVSEPGELVPASAHLSKIGLGYTSSERRDGDGNELRYKGFAVMIEDRGGIQHNDHTHDKTRPIYDVILQISQQ